MTYRRIKNQVEKFERRFYIVELLVILLLGSYILNNFIGFSNIVWINKNFDQLVQKKIFWGHGNDNRAIVSFLRNNLVIDWNYYSKMSTSGKKKVVWPDGDIYNGPVFLSPTEKKPYYLFNIDIKYETFPLMLFRNFTKGDGTLKFVEKHKEIIALVFYKKDAAKVMKVKRNIERVVWENELEDLQKISLTKAQIDELEGLLDSFLRKDDGRLINREALLQILSELDELKSGPGKTLGILFFED